MEIAPLTPAEMPDLDRLFVEVGLALPPENVRQFAWPRRPAPGFETVSLGLFDAGRLVGVIGYLDLPLCLDGFRTTGRWPINLYLLASYRGRGWGRRLMEATRAGADTRLVIGGNAFSTPVLAKTGWRRIGHLAVFHPPAGAPGPPLERGVAVVPVAAAELADLPAPWVEWAPAGEYGVPRDGSYLRFAWGGELASFLRLHLVHAAGEALGFFVLALRREEGLVAEVIDLDALPGREAAVVGAALATAAGAGKRARLHAGVGRFRRAARGLLGEGREETGLPIWLSREEPLPAAALDPESWRLSHGDHDRYRVLATSMPWPDPESWRAASRTAP